MAEPARAMNQDRGEIVVREPATGKEVGRVPVMGVEQVRAAVAKAREAQKRWAERSFKERGKVVRKFRDLVLQEVDTIADLISRENGKPRIEALTHDVNATVVCAGFYASRAHQILAPHDVKLALFPHKRSTISYVPRGVVGAIQPWNFPLAIPQSAIIAALMAGNAVVMKPSEFAPHITLYARELWLRAGLDPELLQIVTGDGSTGAALIDAGIDYLVFTGSSATGRRVAAACGERLIPSSMELGGKAAAIIREDADLDRAARGVAWGGFANGGQVCASIERVYVHEKVAKPFLERLASVTNQLRYGPDNVADSELSAITMPNQLDKIRELVDDAVKHGARVLTGGKAIEERGGRWYAPTVLVDVTDDMRIMREEVFGPVVPVQVVRSDEEAVAKANNTRLGLLGYVFSGDLGKGRALARKIVAGTVIVNDVIFTYAATETPWAGVGDSGWGLSHSAEGLRELCSRRHLNSPRFGSFKTELWWFPYDKKMYNRFKQLQRLLFGRGQRSKALWNLLSGGGE